MEFNEKLQILRKQKNLTQEELSSQIYVSRTAVSKWESGRGYPSIESLKVLARFFGVTVDELISSDEILTIAEESQKRAEKVFRDLAFGLLDICMSLLFFLPLLASKTGEGVQPASLLTVKGLEVYLVVLFFIVVTGIIIIGILTLALQNSTAAVWLKIKTKISLIFGIIATVLFTISLQPYASVFAFSLLAIKSVFLMKKQ